MVPDLTKDSLMPIGKYKGEKLCNVPPWHLLWIYDNVVLPPHLRKYISNNLQDLQKRKKQINRYLSK
jgi:hypothetical protein